MHKIGTAGGEQGEREGVPPDPHAGELPQNETEKVEKKNYITREIDPKDRRKVSISATPEGKAAAEESKKKYDEMWSELLDRFGEENMRQLIRLINELDSLSSGFSE